MTLCDGSAYGWLAGDGWAWSKWACTAAAAAWKITAAASTGSFNWGCSSVMNVDSLCYGV